MQGQMKQWFKIGTKWQKEFERDFNLMGRPKKVIAEKKGKWFNVI